MELRPGWNELGTSLEGRPIRVCANFATDQAGADWTLFLGGTHGDESATVPFLEAFIADHLESEGGGSGLGPLAVLPLLNPDGYARESRYNARGVDLNRNLPEHWSASADEPPGEAPLSEPETRLLYELITRLRPTRIVSLHWALSEIDADGDRAAALAQGMWQGLDAAARRQFRLRVERSRPLPGSLGSFCRPAEAPALVTLELPYHPEPDRHPHHGALPDDHLDTVRRQWRSERERYWRAVYPGVEGMLRCAAAG